ncbi:MAG TPA: DUF4153 domain-containing protein [Caulobacteraceae bacterium]|nr:DUF4153 domain-containing protein [Caulobacteraceae bacterium]
MIAEVTVDEPDIDAEASEHAGARAIGAARLAAGLAQGVALYLLSVAAVHKAWPATTPPLYGALLLAWAIAPLIVVGGLGRIRAATLAIWTLAAAVALGAFGWHDIDAGIWSGLPTATRLEPAFPVLFFGAVFAFVGHHLVGPADEARALRAPYRLYFDWAWKDAVQVVLSAAFVGVLWVSLELGAQLFALIGIDVIQKAIGRPWFWIPVSCLAFAAGVELTDVRVALIRGVRTVGLVLLSWLLPLMTALVVAFLLALPFTGLAPLFGTRAGAATVLSAAAGLIVLVSAAYADGRTPVAFAQRWSGRIACVALTPLILIAAAALAQRVGQHGLTTDRIVAIAFALVGAGFAAGYGIGALRRTGPWLRSLEFTNVAMACVAMLAIFVLLTPIADPARLSAEDQVRRIVSGAVPPDKGDYQFLVDRSGRYGADALKRLAALRGGGRNARIAASALKSELAQRPPEARRPTSFASRFTVFPMGARLPLSFSGQNWNDDPQACFDDQDDNQCVAVLADVDGDGLPEVLVTQETTDRNVVLDIYKQSADGRWWAMGQLNVACPDAVEALKAGRLKLAPKTGYDIELNGRRQSLTMTAPPCPTTPAASNATQAPPDKANLSSRPRAVNP